MKDTQVDKKLWKSLEDLAGKSAKADSHARFNPFNNDFLSRREFLEWTGGMMAVLGAAGCTRQPNEKLVPYTKTPERIIPGKPLFYASAMGLGGTALGVLVETHMGRPTKIEGNPEHPTSLGGSDSFAQASVLSLYDPDRSKVLTVNGQVTFWRNFINGTGKLVAAAKAKKGQGFRILTDNVISPSLGAAIQELLKDMPEAKWHQYEPINRDNEVEGLQMAFGKAVSPWYDFKQAKVVVSFDSDILGDFGGVRYSRDFTEARSVLGGKKEMNRLYAIESSPTVTSSLADHRLPVRAAEVELMAVAIAQALGLSISGKPALNPTQAKWAKEIAADIQANRGQAVFVAGQWQSPVVHAIAHALNSQTGGVGKTVRYVANAETRAEKNIDSMKNLVSAMGAGQVETLVILGGNPVFDAPADLGFANALEKVANRIHCGLYVDETGAKCNWHVPQAHFLESWGDLKAQDGSVTVVQPTVDPLYGGKTHLEVVSAFLGRGEKNAYELIRDQWKSRLSGDFEASWRKAVHDGFVGGNASGESVAVQGASGWKFAGPVGELDILFRPDPSVWDGRFVNNGWLQETPRPLTKLTWDNAALMSPATAEKLKLKNEMLVEIRVGEDKIKAPVWVVPGHCADSITLHLGYGRKMAGRVGNGTGVDVYPLRTSTAAWVRSEASVKATGSNYPLACTQMHSNMEGRNVVRAATLADFMSDPHFAQDHHHGPAALKGMDVGTAGGEYAPKVEADYQWGMVINLSACNGCNACVVACQAENNIPVVGKTEVTRGREMNWLRIDQYYEGSPENPTLHHQPVACVHCETAPCEVVCPVGATVHDNEGLNNMVYNRCVGTKYCSNNCPYKVRHFNFYEYSDMTTPQLKMVRNPDVTVRSRGVMEKCTYCVQRISAARNQAKIEGRKIRDGEVKTACQTACSTQAIIFGDISDPNSKVSRLKEESLNYSLLGELNTKARTTYLAKVGNPNPKLTAESES